MVRPIAIGLAGLLVAAACTPALPGKEATGDKPVAGGRIVDPFSSEIKTLQPVISSDTGSSGVWSIVYYSLTRTNPQKGQIEGQLAEKFDLSADGLTLTYTLRDNLVWSDGAPFTGDDYKYTAEAVMRSKKTIRKPTFENVVGAKDYQDGKADSIAGIQVSPDGKTITIKFSKAFCPALSQMGGAGAGGLIPKKQFLHYWDNKTTDTSKNIDDNPLNLNPPASMGPFVFKEYKPGDHITLVRNDRYFRGPPLIDEYIVKFYSDSTAIKNALMTGEASYSGVVPKDYDELRKIDTLKDYRFGSFSNTYMGWNPRSARAPWLANVLVRQALWYGLDIDTIVQKALFGLAHRLYGYHTPSSWAYDDSDLNKYPYDPAKAKQLLESAGATMGPEGVYRWTDGKPMVMQLETDSGGTREDILQIAQEQYKKIGIKVDALLETFPALTERLRPGNDNFDGFINGAALSNTDPDPYTFWHSSQAQGSGLNRVMFSKADALIEAQRNGPDCSPETRKKIIKDFNKLLNQEAPWTPLYSADNLVFVNKQIQSFDPQPYSTGSFWNIERWWLKR